MVALRWSGRSRRRRPSATLRVIVGGCLALATACNSGQVEESSNDTAEAEVAPATITVPPARLSPFCQAMIDLSDRLATDPPDDVNQYIVDTYLSIVDVVPPEIESDFLVVLAEIQTGDSGSPPTTPPSTEGPADEDLADFDAEGRLPDDDPSERLNAYVDFTCRDSENNPGPPATPPNDVEAAPTDTTSG